MVPHPGAVWSYARPMLRRALPLLVLCVLAACGSDDGGAGAVTTARGPEATTGVTSSETAATANEEPAGGGSGDFDCAEIEESLLVLGIPIQLMAQVRDPANFQSIKDGVMVQLDIDAFLASVQELRVLEAFQSPLGDPGESLDVYEEAGLAMKVLMEKDTVTQADIDEYNTNVVEVGEFLGHQIAISGALDEAGC